MDGDDTGNTVTDRDPDTVAVLARHLRRLDTDACAALVADLWDARGFETRREGPEVVATGRGTARRVRVGTGGRTGDPPDVVVSPRGGGVWEAAAGVRVVDAEELAGMLRYAVDRETGATLCERHLGAPPGELRPPAGTRLRTRLRGLRGSIAVGPRELPVGLAPLLAAVLVVLVGTAAGVALTAGPGAPSASADAGGPGEADGVEPVPVPESTPVGDDDVRSTRTAGGSEGTPPGNASAVPGLTDDGVADLSALAAAHARGLLGRSYTLWMDTYRASPGADTPTRFDTDVAVAGDRFLVEENVGDDEDRRRLRTVYHDGEDWHVANRTGTGTVYERVEGREPPPAPDPEEVALTLVADYLSTPQTSVERRGGTGGPRYRLVGRGTPPAMDVDAVRNYTAVALVDRDGVVRDLTVRYAVVTGEGRFGVRKEWTYGRLGETTVQPPPWYVERFAANGTAAGTPGG